MFILLHGRQKDLVHAYAYADLPFLVPQPPHQPVPRLNQTRNLTRQRMLVRLRKPDHQIIRSKQVPSLDHWARAGRLLNPIHDGFRVRGGVQARTRSLVLERTVVSKVSKMNIYTHVVLHEDQHDRRGSPNFLP